MDVNYTIGTNADCGLPLCCRDGVPDTEANAAGPYGHYKCALPLPTLNEILTHAKATHDVSFKIGLKFAVLNVTECAIIYLAAHKVRVPYGRLRTLGRLVVQPRRKQ